jgi:hypothetical protein
MGRPWPQRVLTKRSGCGQAPWTASSARPATASACSCYRRRIASGISARQAARRSDDRPNHSIQPRLARNVATVFGFAAGGGRQHGVRIGGFDRPRDARPFIAKRVCARVSHAAVITNMRDRRPISLFSRRSLSVDFRCARGSERFATIIALGNCPVSRISRYVVEMLSLAHGDSCRQ